MAVLGPVPTAMISVETYFIIKTISAADPTNNNNINYGTNKKTNNDNRFHSLRFLKTCPWVSGLRKCNQSYKRNIGAKAWRSQAKVYKMGTKWRWRGTGQTGQKAD